MRGSRSAAQQLIQVEQVSYPSADGDRPMLIWRAGPGWQMISSAVLGGGTGERAWVINAQVAHGYDRTDPDRHLTELATNAGLTGPGVGLMTAAWVTDFAWAIESGVEAVATAGIGACGWAASRELALEFEPGTINVTAALPVRLAPGALVNAVTTATEAKVQALLASGFDGSGTPTDAICVASRQTGPAEPFAGPRSVWGSRLARAVYRATYQAAVSYLERSGRLAQSRVIASRVRTSRFSTFHDRKRRP